MKSITAIVHTKNSQDTLPRTLDSLLWADEILVVDMGSTDKTREIAQSKGARIIDVEDVGFADPMRNKGIEAAKNEWILVVDSDEEVPQSLAQYIHSLDPNEADVYRLPRKNILFGQWLQYTGWWPDYQYHLFKKGHVSWSDKVHTHPTFKGRVKDIPPQGELAKIHHNYQTIEQFINRLNRYTSLQAKRDQSHQPSPFQAFSSELASRLVAQEGYKDKTHGYYISLLQALYQTVVALKLWESQGFKEGEPKGDLDQMIKELNHWHIELQLKQASPFQKLILKLKRKLLPS